MPVFDAVFVGKIHLPEIGGGPIIPPGMPQPPLGIWGGPWQPPYPAHPIYNPPYPSHPIVIPPEQPPGQPPLGIWGGPWQPPYPDHGLPPYPSHPIVLPPTDPGDTVPVDPGYFPPGVAVPVPPPEGGEPTKAYVVAYTRTPSGPQRVTFLVDLPVYPPPEGAQPKA